jgi:ABC transporter with metal-binding/Fe-S-binding domain ATP-binding protein
MKAGILFSGGKDSTYAAYLAKKVGYELSCLITIYSENPDSYMFHTPSISKTKKQAEVMNLPLIIGKTKGKKEEELKDFKKIIRRAISKYKIDTLVTGALHSQYQKSRIQKICDELKIKCFNPLWHKDEFEYLKELIKNNFKVILTGVASEGLDEKWLGREINEDFIADIKKVYEKYKIHVAGEGGEFETFVLNAPGLFKRELKVIDKKIFGKGNAWRMEIEVEID